MTTDQQVRRLMTLIKQGVALSTAALKTGMSEPTARKYRAIGRLPSQVRRHRDWRTRTDPFEEVWPEVEELLERDGGLQAKAVFEELGRRYPGRFQEGQLRTLQRRFRRWRALRGPQREVYFPQVHRPGEQAQSDFTSLGSLEIVIDLVPGRLAHLARAGRREHQELEREFRRLAHSCIVLHLRDTLSHILVRERGHMPPLHPVARQRRVNHDARWIVGAVALGHRPPADRRDALLDATRRLTLLVPNGLEDGHDLARRDLGHWQRAETRIGVGLKTRPPLRPRLRVAPVRRVDGNDCLRSLGERRRGGRLPASRGSPPALAIFQRSKAAARASARPIAG